MKKETKENSRLYVADFIRLKKGPDKVALETGISRGTLYQIIQGRNGVSRKTADRLAATYTDFDLNKAIGLDTEATNNVDITMPESALVELGQLRALVGELQTEVRTLKKALSDSQNETKDWQNAYRSLAEKRMGIDREYSKIESSGHVTVREVIDQQMEEWKAKQPVERNLIGFGRSDAKVLQHPATHELKQMTA